MSTEIEYQAQGYKHLRSETYKKISQTCEGHLEIDKT
jgi:hypothetical protein